MIIFLVLCACLRTLQAVPLLPPHASSFVAAVDLVGRDSPVGSDCGGPQCRSIYTIVQSCLLTIFTCVWTSLHPNINGPRDSDWTCFKRKVVTMVIAVVAPEFVLFWALRQRVAANQIAKTYNKEFAKPVQIIQTEKSLRGKVVNWFLSLWGIVMARFLPLSEGTTRRGVGQSWSTTHGFFIQMGGFILYDGEYPKRVLDYYNLAQLLRDKAIDAPTVTERNLQDRSKGDTISKAIAMLQTTWFGFQCFARWGQHLPLSELEVLTLAFAAMNMAIYATWWDKPQGVNTAICVPLKKAEKVIANSVSPPTGHGEEQGLESSSDDSDLGPANKPYLDYHQLNKNVPLIPPLKQQDISTGEKHSWLRHKLQKDREQHSSPVFFLLRLPYRIVSSVVHLLMKTGDPFIIDKKGLRLPMFYASHEGPAGIAILLASCGIGTIFGAIHLLAWASQFPSPRDVVLWRVSAIMLTVTPFVALLRQMAMVVTIDYITDHMVYLIFLLSPFYIIGRFVVIIIALLAIHDPPRDVLRDISWTSYIPHF